MKTYRWIASVTAALVLLSGCSRSPSTAPVQETVTMIRPTVSVGEAVTATVSETTVPPESTEFSGFTATEAEPLPIGSTVKQTSAASDTTTASTLQTTAFQTGATVQTTVPTVTTTTASRRPTASSDEVRAAWVSYIELNEILQDCRTPAQARTAVDAIMTKLADFRINTVFFHVRANSDAYYTSTVFKPAATVKSLQEAGFDLLAYAVEAAHRCGMALHAWVNPYRVGKDTAYKVANIPTLKDEKGRCYYVPTSTAAQQLILDGVREIVRGYAVDGIQYDDYFYPEDLLEEGTVYGFESEDYTAYRSAGGTLGVGDWRRAGVDNLIAATHAVTAAQNIVFGVSPAVSAEKTYTSLYADCRKWLAQTGYVDYLCPQIYTGFEHTTRAFDTMVDTWMGYERHASVKLYVGLALYKIGSRSDAYAGTGKYEWSRRQDIMKRSVLYLRQKKIPGLCFYSYSYFQPSVKAGLSSTADVKVAEAEIKNLLSVL